MFRIEDYTVKLLAQLKGAYADRLLYVGLQGSFLRNEANENSDIDIMVVIDNLTAQDFAQYQKALIAIGDYEKSCGFICGKDDLANWNKLEICHLLHTTRDIYGVLSNYLPEYTTEDVRSYIKLSVGNLYHELCHRYVHSDPENNIKMLPITCKQIFFIMQNLYYYKNQVFFNSKHELLTHLTGIDAEVLSVSLSLQSSEEYDFDYTLNLLL